MSNNNLISNFYQAIINNAARFPNHIIIFEEKIKITNYELKNYIDNVASFLKQNQINAGDKVALIMSNSWQFVVNFFAISKIGAVVVPVNNFLREDEIAYILNDSQAKLLFSSAKFASETREMMLKTNVTKIVWVDGIPIENVKNIDFTKVINNNINSALQAQSKLNDLAVIIYTSGTTGKPKGAMLSFGNMISNALRSMEHMRLKVGQAKMICYLPMFHAFTLTVTVIVPIVSNSAIIIIRSISTKKDFANLLKQVLFKRVRFFTGVPDVYSALSRAKLPWYFHWLHNVKGFISGAAPLSEEVINKFNKAFRRGSLLQGYGISECSPVVSTNMPWENKIGSVGKVLPGSEVAIFDENMQKLAINSIGEICVKGECVMLGYYNRPKETVEAIINGWFRTGDIGKIDSEGFIFILDRKKDLIINKGINIYPREIEEVLYTCDKVNACAVVGLKDLEANETPVAYVELREDETATEAELKAFIKPYLAPFKQPRRIIFKQKLPRNATGKILKRELRDELNQSSALV